MIDSKPKRGNAENIVDFTTALPPADCRARLERSNTGAVRAGNALAPVTQRVFVQDDVFTVERSFPFALHPIRMVGHLDPDAGSGGTWVHGAITHTTDNQILIEGLVVFVLFFLFAALFFVRLRAEGLVVSGVLLALTLTLLSVRWRALRRATDDIARWLRQRLYLTAEQIRRTR